MECFNSFSDMSDRECDFPEENYQDAEKIKNELVNEDFNFSFGGAGLTEGISKEDLFRILATDNVDAKKTAPTTQNHAENINNKDQKNTSEKKFTYDDGGKIAHVISNFGIKVKKDSENKIFDDLKAYIGDAGGYSEKDTNDFLYSTLCQMSRDDFKEIIDYVNKNNNIFPDIVKKLKNRDTGWYFIPNEFSEAKSFLEAVSKSKIALGGKYSQDANYMRAGILLKLIEGKLENKLENDVENHSDIDLSELIKNKAEIEFSEEEAKIFLSTLGKKDVMVSKFSGGKYKAYGSVPVSFFVVEAVSKLLSKSIFVYVSKSDDRVKPIGFIFKKAGLQNDGDSMPQDGQFPQVDSEAVGKVNSFLKKATAFWQERKDNKDNHERSGILYFYHVSNRNSDYIVPLGLNSAGKKYVGKGILDHISLKVSSQNENQVNKKEPDIKNNLFLESFENKISKFSSSFDLKDKFNSRKKEKKLIGKKQKRHKVESESNSISTVKDLFADMNDDKSQKTIELLTKLDTSKKAPKVHKKDNLKSK